MSLNYLMRIVDLENSVKQKTITITQLRNAIEKAVLCLEDGDYDEAVELLKGFV